MYRLRAPLDFSPPYAGTLLGFVPDDDGIIEVPKNYLRMFFKRLNFEDISPPPKRDDIKRLLVIMQGGLGDTLFATPGIKALKEQRPDVEIFVCTWNIGLGVVENNPYIDGQLFTISSELAMHYPDFDEVIDFSRVISYNPEAEYVNSYDIYSQHFEELFDIKVEDKNPNVFLTDEEKIRARNVLIDNGVKPTDKVVGIVDRSSNIVRSWPFEYSLELAYRLVEAGYKVVMLGHSSFLETRRYFTCPSCGASQYVDISTHLHIQSVIRCCKCNEINIITGDNHVPGILWTMGKTNVRQAMALVSQCDLLIGPDSGLIHAAGALRVPSLGLFGPFHSDVRVRYMPEANVIQSDLKCAPCFSYNFHIHECPLGGPNAPCMWNITPDEVFEKAINILSGIEQYPPPPIEIITDKPKECIVCSYGKPRLMFRKRNVEYFQCPQCRCIFSHNAPDNDWNRYQDRWTIFDDKMREVLDNEVNNDNNDITEFLQKKNSDVRLLELGVRDAYYLNKMANRGFDVYGIEASSINIEENAKNYGEWMKNKLLNINFIDQDDIERIKGVCPDVIVARNFIEHFKDPKLLWRNFHDILADDGILIICGPSNEIIGLWNESPVVNTEEAGQHKFMPSRDALEILCERYGFTPLSFSVGPNRDFRFIAKKKR